MQDQPRKDNRTEKSREMDDFRTKKVQPTNAEAANPEKNISEKCNTKRLRKGQARRRKTGRDSLRTCKAKANTGARLGEIAGRLINASVRLFFDTWQAMTAREAAKRYGLSLSQIYEIAAEIAAAMEAGDQRKVKEIIARLERLERNIAKGAKGRRRRNETANDRALKKAKPGAKVAEDLKISGWRLAEIAIIQEENREQGKGRTFSEAARQAVKWGLVMIRQIMKAGRAGNIPQEFKEPRQWEIRKAEKMGLVVYSGWIQQRTKPKPKPDGTGQE